MQRLEIIGNQIRYTGDLQTVVHTMKIYSAAKIRQYERAVFSLSEYFRTVELGLQILYHNRIGQISDLSGESYGTGIIVFGSGQPFCGSFDERLAAYVNENLKSDQINEPEVITVGDRIADFIKFYGIKTGRHLEVPGTLNGMNELILNMLDALDYWDKAYHIRRVILFHNKPVTQSGFAPRLQRLLPLDKHWLMHLAERTWPTNNLPAYPPPARLLTASLIKQYLFVSLYRAGAESLAAEYGSRLAAMTSAEQKIKDHLAGLKILYRQVRQTAIDEELLDIRSGYESVMEQFQ